MNRRKFPVIPVIEHRTNADTRTETENNCLGPTPFSMMPHLDLIKDFVSNSMHCVYTGVTKRMVDILQNGVQDKIFKLTKDQIDFIGLKQLNLNE